MAKVIIIIEDQAGAKNLNITAESDPVWDTKSNDAMTPAQLCAIRFLAWVVEQQEAAA